MACPTCGGMFANNTKFFDHIRRQTALDRKPCERGRAGCEQPLAGLFGLPELPVLCERRALLGWQTSCLL